MRLTKKSPCEWKHICALLACVLASRFAVDWLLHATSVLRSSLAGAPSGGQQILLLMLAWLLYGALAMPVLCTGAAAAAGQLRVRWALLIPPFVLLLPARFGSLLWWFLPPPPAEAQSAYLAARLAELPQAYLTAKPLALYAALAAGFVLTLAVGLGARRLPPVRPRTASALSGAALAVQLVLMLFGLRGLLPSPDIFTFAPLRLGGFFPALWFSLTVLTLSALLAARRLNVRRTAVLIGLFVLAAVLPALVVLPVQLSFSNVWGVRAANAALYAAAGAFWLGTGALFRRLSAPLKEGA